MIDEKVSLLQRFMRITVFLSFGLIMAACAAPQVAPASAGAPADAVAASTPQSVTAPGSTAANCIDFSVYSDNTAFAPQFRLRGVEFTAVSGGIPFVNQSGDLTGLQFDPDGVQLTFPKPATNVRLTAASFTSSELAITALDPANNTVDSSRIAGNSGAAAVEVTGEQIASVTISGGGFEGILINTCSDVALTDLDDITVRIPYTTESLPPFGIGDAQLVPDYPPILAAIEQLAPQLREFGVTINPARTVLLREDEIGVNNAEGVYTESVAIAPVGPPTWAGQNSEEFERQLTSKGVVLGILLLETTVPDSPLPPGPYIEVAYGKVQSAEFTYEGSVVLLNVNGEVSGETPLLAKQLQGLTINVPTAAILYGTKWCITCGWDGFCQCRACSWWQILNGEGADYRSTCESWLGQ